MYVLLVAPYAPRGGGMGRMMEYLYQAQPAGVYFEMVESRGGGAALSSAWHALRAALRILQVRVQRGPVIVHVNMAEGSSVFRKGALLLLGRALGMPTVLHLHAADIIGFYQRLPAPGRLLMRAIFRSATVCLVLGESWRVFLRQELGLARSRTVVLRNGVPLPAVRRVAAEAPFGFVFVGNLLARKGLVDLLHAAADARLAEHNWRLIIAGGGDTTRLRTLVATLGIGSRVAFTGWLGRADTSHILAQAGALVLPSYLEALPLVLAEAASLGVPIVATPVGAIGEIFEDGLTALLVAPGDRLALAAAMLRLVTEPALSARLGRGGRAVYERTLTLDRFVDGLMGVYAGHCQAAPARAAAL